MSFIYSHIKLVLLSGITYCMNKLMQILKPLTGYYFFTNLKQKLWKIK